ncbi:MAG: tRNA (adenosine(37)-N6)-threonylcarbamoyltransferase complex transferase subunit TsaD [Chloroflexia bacterium]
MNILAIETSCDETSVAIVRDGRHIVTNVIASQIALHQKYGGVVPELASRQHIVTIIPVLEEALTRANMSWVHIDAVAVTRGPGLSPALLVGVNAAKAIAFARGKPLVAVNHIEGHIYSNWLIPEAQALSGDIPFEPRFPALCLIVSGGHTELVLMTGHGQYRLLGKTIDDAAGEAFDKAARILGLGYPGGPAIQRAAEGGNPERFPFPRAWLKGTHDFSFSGLKTALLRKVQEYGFQADKPAPWQTTQPPAPTPPQLSGTEGHEGDRAARTAPQVSMSTTRLVDVSTFTAEESAPPVAETAPGALAPPPPVRVAHAPNTRAPSPSPAGITHTDPLPVADLAASFQAALVDALVEKTAAAAAEFGAREVLVAGGVAANALLRQSLGERLRVPLRYPPLVLCTDNAAMIAAAAYYRYADSLQYDFTLDIEPNARFI